VPRGSCFGHDIWVTLARIAEQTNRITDPESVKALPSGAAWLASVERVSESVRHLSVHRGHNRDVSNSHDLLVDVTAAKQMTFTGTREELRGRLTQLEARGATGIIFGTSALSRSYCRV
jgi:alkanesulfonate monooxygenase SsuD/methylene tetrahydromethanopterin reductase-like flavin-dependent oxidoreductase (luciferase family)